MTRVCSGLLGLLLVAGPVVAANGVELAGEGPADGQPEVGVVGDASGDAAAGSGIKYDDASWHYEGDFPEGQPPAHGGTHIALFLRWCFIKGWASQMHLDEQPEAVAAVIAGTMPATEFLFRYSDEKLTSYDLNDTGNAFAARYYGDNGLYLDDYANTFGDQMYVASEAAHDFAKFSAMVEARLASGVLTTADQPEAKP